MKRTVLLRLAYAGLATVGLTVPAAAGEAPTPQRGQAQSDVELDPGGWLRGMVVDIQGVPLANVPVVVRQGDREVAKTATDALGCFAVGELRGGTYQVAAGNHARLFRVWVARTAPPGARRLALLIAGEPVVRGQRPLLRFWTSERAVTAGVLAAMIAVPIAVYNRNHQVPSSP